MFKFIKDGKIVGVSEEALKGGGVVDEMIEDEEHTVDDYEQYDGEYLLKSEIPAPTLEEQKEKRAQAYLVEVDPITAHIQRERDEKEPDEEKINELLKERADKVQEIKERFPYPEGKEEAV